MRKNIYMSILLFLFFFLYPNNIYASCAPPASLSEYKEKAHTVILGTITHTTDTTATVAVEKYFKSTGPKEITISGMQAPPSITTVDISFQAEKKYLLFLQDPSTTRIFYLTNACMGNKIVEGNLSQEELKVLEETLPEPTKTSPGPIRSIDKNSPWLRFLVPGIAVAAILFIFLRKR